MKKSREDVQLIKHEMVAKSYFQLDRYTLRHRLFNGDWSPEITRDVFERGNAAAVVLFDPDLDQIVLVEQFRPGVYAAGDQKPWTLEIVAGIVEPGEDVNALVRREAEEEANLVISDLSNELVPRWIWLRLQSGGHDAVRIKPRIGDLIPPAGHLA